MTDFQIAMLAIVVFFGTIVFLGHMSEDRRRRNSKKF